MGADRRSFAADEQPDRSRLRLLAGLAALGAGFGATGRADAQSAPVLEVGFLSDGRAVREGQTVTHEEMLDLSERAVIFYYNAPEGGLDERTALMETRLLRQQGWSAFAVRVPDEDNRLNVPEYSAKLVAGRRTDIPNTVYDLGDQRQIFAMSTYAKRMHLRLIGQQRAEPVLVASL